MAVGDVIDIGGRAFKEVAATKIGGEDTAASYAMLVVSEDGASIGSPSDPAWNGVSANATVISLLKKIALNTTP